MKARGPANHAMAAASGVELTARPHLEGQQPDAPHHLDHTYMRDNLLPHSEKYPPSTDRLTQASPPAALPPGRIRPHE